MSEATCEFFPIQPVKGVMYSLSRLLYSVLCTLYFTEDQTQQPEVPEVSTPRRSQRVTQMPEQFKDYVTSFR